jgi:hypothetical protein
MKKRQGFVSNSSVSSFVILGFKINLDDFGDKEKQYKLFGSLPEDIVCVYRNGKEYVYGVEIANISYNGDYLEESEYGFEELKEKLRKGCEASDIPMPNQIKIFTVTRET